MKNILVIGAGRSATSLIEYLLNQSTKYDWKITVADMSMELAEEKINNHPNGTATTLNATENTFKRGQLVQQADIVVSLLPPHLHDHVAKDCLKYGKHLATASYVSARLGAMQHEVKEKNLLFLCEMGLDPGIDHMSAMQLIHEIKDNGGEITAFRSYAGGLVAPESDNNPWHYKFSWSPRNVVLAGQGIATYLQDGQYKHVPYHRLFAEAHTVEIPGMGTYEGYPNRASLIYQKAYELENVPTLLRGTLRYKGYCEAWDLLVQIGLTDDTYILKYSEDLTLAQWLDSYLPKGVAGKTLRERVANHFDLDVDADVLDKVEWLGLFSDQLITLDDASPAQILQHVLEAKWKLEKGDKDMIIMQHELEYMQDGNPMKHVATLVQKGENDTKTAMANLVGLPLAIGVKNVMLGNINLTGIHIPIRSEIYDPVMTELEEYGVHFAKQEMALSE